MLPSVNADELPVRPVVSNFDTPVYHIAKYLLKLLSPLSQPIYTVNSTEHFIGQIKNKHSIFRSIPLEKTIEITFPMICDSMEISTQIPKKLMKEFLLFCAKELHFIYEDGIHQKTDGVVMGSPLGPILTSIFMVELGTAVVPTLDNVLFKCSSKSDM